MVEIGLLKLTRVRCSRDIGRGATKYAKVKCNVRERSVGGRWSKWRLQLLKISRDSKDDGSEGNEELKFSPNLRWEREDGRNFIGWL